MEKKYSTSNLNKNSFMLLFHLAPDNIIKYA